MKHKYGVLETTYTDGTTVFFPQSYDWWHGWRFIAYADPHNPDCPVRYALKSREEAEDVIRRLIESQRTGKAPGRPATVERVRFHRLKHLDWRS